MPQGRFSRVLGVPLSRFRFAEALAAITDHYQKRQGGTVHLCNVHTVTQSTRDAKLKDCFEGALFNFTDGVPLVWALKAQGHSDLERVCGPDLMPAFLKAHPHSAIGFIGGATGVAQKLIDRFNLTQALAFSPPLREFSEANALEDFQNFSTQWKSKFSGAALPAAIFVGLGAPKQEYWMQAVSKTQPEILFFGVGAAFDFHAGTKARAPEWMQKTGLEWAHRLASEPGRLTGRYLDTNLRFLYKISGEVLLGKGRK